MNPRNPTASLVVGDPFTVYVTEAGHSFLDPSVTSATSPASEVLDGVVSLSITPDALDLDVTVHFLWGQSPHPAIPAPAAIPAPSATWCRVAPNG